MNLPASSYDARANLFRPTDPAVLAQEVKRQAATGLTPNDIAQALRLDPTSVRNMLGKKETAYG